MRQGGTQKAGWPGAEVSATGLPGSERDRGGVAPDEARRAGHPVRHIRQDVQRH